MHPSPELPRPNIDIERLVGRSLDVERIDVERHAAELWQAVGSREELWTLVPPGPFLDAAGFRQFLADRTEVSNARLLALVDKRQGVPTAAGLYFLINIRPEHGICELGLMYGAALSRQIGGTEAFYLTAHHVFRELGYRRLEWRCAADHQHSRAAAERFGFTLEGVLRQNAWLKGRSFDTAIYSLLDHEWPAVERRLQLWLDPANFDAEGRQIVELSALAAQAQRD